MSRGPTKTVRGLVRACRSSLALGLLCCALLPGCKLGERQAETDDPMRGAWPSGPPAAGKLAKDDPLARTPGSEDKPAVPPVPVPGSASTTSLAALTSGVNQTLDPHSPADNNATLAVGGAGPAPVILLTKPQPIVGPSAGFAPADESPVVLTPPVVQGNSDRPLYPTSYPASYIPPPPPAPGTLLPVGIAPGTVLPPDPGFHSAGSAHPIESFAQAQQELLARRMVDQNLDQIGPDTWRFSCAIQNRNDPTLVSRYEAAAPGEGGLAAIRAVIAQIDHINP